MAAGQEARDTSERKQALIQRRLSRAHLRRRGREKASSYGARGLSVHFSGLRAVDGVDLELAAGEILGLIGPNGAGKTTLVNALTGFQMPTAGHLFIGEAEVTGYRPHQLARLGIARTFQSGRLFGHLTVLENVEVAALAPLRWRRRARPSAEAILDRVGLRSLQHRRAGGLSHGEGRRLELARAVATSPTFLLLDEPAAGLNERESDILVDTIAELPGRVGCGVLVIEHDMRVIMRLCSRIQVLNYGQTIAVGSPDEVRADPTVLEAYLGSEGAASATD